MDLTKSIKQAIEIVKLNIKAIDKVAKDKEATTAGILILIIGGLIAGIASKKWVLLGITPIIVLILSFIGVGILHLLAKLFGGKAEFIELYRALTHASILNWLSIFELVPVIGGIVTLITSMWGIVVNFVIIKDLYKLSTAKTIFVLLIPAIFMLVIIAITFTMIAASNPKMLESFF